MEFLVFCFLDSLAKGNNYQVETKICYGENIM